jgi:hypothetical protein
MEGALEDMWCVDLNLGEFGEVWWRRASSFFGDLVFIQEVLEKGHKWVLQFFWSTMISRVDIRNDLMRGERGKICTVQRCWR